MHRRSKASSGSRRGVVTAHPPVDWPGYCKLPISLRLCLEKPANGPTGSGSDKSEILEYGRLSTQKETHGRALRITSAHVQGVVVEARPKSSFLLVRIDDGTGIVGCMLWHNPPPVSEGARDLIECGGTVRQKLLGKFVSVRGRLRRNWKNDGEREMNIQEIGILSDPNAETLWMLELCQAAKEIARATAPDGDPPPSSNGDGIVSELKEVTVERGMARLLGPDDEGRGGVGEESMDVVL
ncbi:unnamed protein product [Vitrella brassicaformis CCMP3155]|uniref:OB domain-containing protein n=2 Tax=Vitrella brassicaformis TaxID=1169539 RepID=A0A0G4EV14_VITBC|nr:unnamed protein product [Vitrella brassicaformis CCMP3155]|eukprot:CEM02089.1 unnamed protein product [Vitrella brassicaformis CCMP3155]